MKNKSNRNEFEKFVLNKAKPHLYKIVLSIFSSIIRSTLMLLPIMFTQRAINSISEHMNFSQVVLQSSMLVIMPAVVLLLYVADTIMCRYVYDIIKDVRLEALQNLLGRKLRFIKGEDSQIHYNKIVKSSIELGDFFFSSLSNVTWYIFTIVVGCTFMFLIEIKIAAVLLLLTVLQVWAMYKRKNDTKKLSKSQNELSIRANIDFMRTFDCNAYIKIADLKELEEAHFNSYISDYKKNLKMEIINQLIGNWYHAFFEASKLLVLLCMGKKLLVSQQLLPGDIVALNSYCTWLMPVLSGLQQWLLSGFHSQVSKGRLEEYFENKPIKKMTDDNYLDGDIVSIQLENVGFSYTEDESLLFNGINILLNKNDKLMIVGKSGSGKSTLLQILAGFEEPTQGEIYVNGACLRKVDERWFRKNLIYCSQEPEILEGTLYHNLCYSGRIQSEEKIKRMLDEVGLSNFSDKLHDTIDSTSNKFSDGERKRIGIVRALLSGSSTILFDEPTSGLDPVTGKKVMKLIQSYAQNKIIVIVTHDESLLSNESIILKLA